MMNVEVDIVCNFRCIFTNKSIKHAVFRKMIFNMEDPENKAIQFGAHINNIRLFLFMYIESHNRL